MEREGRKEGRRVWCRAKVRWRDKNRNGEGRARRMNVDSGSDFKVPFHRGGKPVLRETLQIEGTR